MSLKDRMLGEDSDKLSVEQIWAFLDATDEVGLLARDRIEIYAWVNRTLRHHDYAKLPRRQGLVLRFALQPSE